MLPAAEMSVLCSSPSLWQLVAFFAAIGLTALWSGPIMRTMWPDAGGFFSTYLSVRRYGCDHDKLCRGLSFPLVLIATVCFVLGSNSYVQARGSLIAERPFFSLHENTYEYSEIKSIETGETRLGRGYGRDYFIAFRDGTGFDFYKRLPSGGESERRKLAEVISKKSGVPITEVSRF